MPINYVWWFWIIPYYETPTLSWQIDSIYLNTVSLNNGSGLEKEIRSVGITKVMVFWKKFGETRLRKLMNTKESGFSERLMGGVPARFPLSLWLNLEDEATRSLNMQKSGSQTYIKVGALKAAAGE